MMVSWWKDSASLTAFFKSPAHREMMRWLVQNPEALVLWNETYQPQESGMYLHEPHGFGLHYPHAPGRQSKHEASPVSAVNVH
jgi:heme-degrading monooxygenase HmoA